MSKKAEKTSVEKLTEELLINRKNGFMDVTDEQVKKADKFCEGYKTFRKQCVKQYLRPLRMQKKTALFHLTERLLIKRETKYIITIEINL